ncbi:hypothetical protein GF356_07810, partial [candidate division GN15 bacterium]|nr:hypothetical protein [candidate division GN15 bacterium]
MNPRCLLIISLLILALSGTPAHADDAHVEISGNRYEIGATDRHDITYV